MTAIPDEAIEAAATVLCHDLIGGLGHDQARPCEGCVSDARAALTAAAPHIIAARDTEWRDKIGTLTRKWRDEQDALRAEFATSEVAQMLAAALGGMTRQHCDDLAGLLREENRV